MGNVSAILSGKCMAKHMHVCEHISTCNEIESHMKGGKGRLREREIEEERERGREEGRERDNTLF